AQDEQDAERKSTIGTGDRSERIRTYNFPQNRVIDPKDLRVDIYHASGAGGQNVNKVATAVRIVHLPTNIKVEMQEERTQQKNREKAMKIIRARVADHFAQIAQDEQDAERKSTIGTGDRSERIRTYNFPQNRV
ncbi:peptide chain release factor-like protein, partial [Haemophilus influenzae]|uniref:peptide chain release factor-like protein n=1 Tax=Haemophilus influenzae TaxID=727 RepID=UPI0034DD5AAD